MAVQSGRGRDGRADKDRLFLKDCGAVECAEELQGILRLQSDGVGGFFRKKKLHREQKTAPGKLTEK